MKPKRILHLIASPRDASRSRAVANTYLESVSQASPQAAIEELDLWSLALPEIDGPTLNAKYAILAGKPHDPREAEAWKRVQEITQHFLSFDHFVISTPMWNLSIPYRLKHYIDIITQPSLTFSWTPERGYEGLVRGRSALVTYASAFDYTASSPLNFWDQQKSFLQTWLHFIGIADVQTIDCGPTRPGQAGMEQAQLAADYLARQLSGKVG